MASKIIVSSASMDGQKVANSVCHGSYAGSGTAAAGPSLAAGCEGFLVQGLSGNTVFSVNGTAVVAGGLGQIGVLAGESIFIKAQQGAASSLIEIT